jgi:hypothetical protein
MIFSSILLSSVLLVPAQRPGEGPQNTQPATAAGATGKAPSAMAEDIEILRRVFAKKLYHSGWTSSAAHAGTTANTFLPSVATQIGEGGWSGTSGTTYAAYDGSVSSVEGVYLPGYGVVMTLTLPASRRDGKASDDQPVSKPMSDWDRAQAEWRGEKPAASPQTGAARLPSVRDIILHVLADNGHHVSHLRDDERITVVVTFRGGDSFFAPMSTTLGSTSNPFQPMMGASSSMNQMGVAPLITAQQGSGNKQPSSARDYEMLGDLHLKQMQYQAAAEAYKKAISVHEEESQGNRSADSQKLLSTLLARQAQAQIGMGQNDRAVALLQQAQSAGSTLNPATAKAPASKPRVPTKLIISATRRQLGALGAGQMNFDEFRRSASVEDE